MVATKTPAPPTISRMESGRLSVPLSLEASMSATRGNGSGSFVIFQHDTTFPHEEEDTANLLGRVLDPAVGYQTQSMPMLGRTLSDRRLMSKATGTTPSALPTRASGAEKGEKPLTVDNVQAFVDASPVRKAKEVRTRFDLRSWVVHLKNLKTMAEKGTLAYDAQKPLDSSGARSADGWVPLMQDKGPAMHASRLSMIPHDTLARDRRYAELDFPGENSTQLRVSLALGRTAMVRGGSDKGYTGANDSLNKTLRTRVEEREALDEVHALQTPGRAKLSQRIAPLVSAVKTGFSTANMLHLFLQWDPDNSGSIAMEHAPGCLMACVKGDPSLHAQLVLEEVAKEGMVASGLFRYKDFIDFIKDQSTASL